MEPSAISVSQAKSGSGQVIPVFSYDISLNRTGPNTLELPLVPVVAVAGHPLTLDFTNYGKAMHLTVSSSTIAPYAKFSHENIFIDYRESLEIPILPDAPTGEFTLEIITGYGARKESLRVTIQDAASLQFDNAVTGRYARFRLAIITPGPVLIVLGVLLYGIWFTLLRNDLLSIVAFLALLGGALYPWYLRR